MLLAALAAALCMAAADPDVSEFLDDPILYPPEVMEGDGITGGEIRVQNGGALVLQHSSVAAEIHAGLARVTLVQTFKNPYEEALEATYLFPLPALAAVDSMDMICGERHVEGIIMERGAARRAYEAARDEGHKAALLEQERDNLFTQSIAGLCPGETVEIVLQYVEQVPYEDGLYTLSIPLTVGERYSPPWVEDRGNLDTPYERTGREVDLSVYIEEGIPVESVWSDTHAIEIPEEGSWGAAVELASFDRIPNKDFVLVWSLAGSQPRASVVTHRPDPEEPGYLALTLEPQLLDDLFQPRPRELMFVIDESCSMRGEPFEIARATVLTALKQMGPDDTFNLVTFADRSRSLFEAPKPSTEATRAEAREWLQVFDGGGTQMETGIIHSLTAPGDPDHLRLVLMLTDGFIGGEDSMFATVKRYLGDSRLFALGIGSSTNRYLLEGLAEMGRGDVSYQLRGTPIQETVDSFYARIAHPGMSNIQVDWGDLEVTEQYPTRIPDLWAGQPLRVVARYEGTGPSTVRVTGLVGTQTYGLDLPVEVLAADPAHEAVATLWARRKVRDLEWYPHGRSPAEVRQAVIDVALEHHLVTKYTSLVAIDDAPSACGPASLSVQVPQELPAGTGISSSLLGGAGSVTGFGGLGSRGRGSGSSGYGSGGGSFGAKGVGGIGRIGGDPIVIGSIDKSLIEAVIKRHMNQVRYCYQRELTRDPALAGRVTVRFAIAADGSVSKAEVQQSTLGNAVVEACLVQRFLRFAFPEPAGGGTVVVNYPFVFSAG